MIVSRVVDLLRKNDHVVKVGSGPVDLLVDAVGLLFLIRSLHSASTMAASIRMKSVFWLSLRPTIVALFDIAATSHRDIAYRSHLRCRGDIANATSLRRPNAISHIGRTCDVAAISHLGCTCTKCFFT